MKKRILGPILCIFAIFLTTTFFTLTQCRAVAKEGPTNYRAQNPSNNLHDRVVNIISEEFKGSSIAISKDEKGREFLHFPGSKPIDVTGIAEDESIPLIIEVKPGKKAEIHKRYGHGAAKYLPFVYARLNRGQLKKMDRKGITKIYPNMALGIPAPQADDFEPELSDSVNLIKDPEKWAEIENQMGVTLDGTGSVIAILDTGIDFSHPDLEGRIIASEVFTGEESAQDRHGHGTHVAGIAAGSGRASNGLYKGVAPNASVVAGKVLNDNGTGYSSLIISGIEWAFEQGADVINMSLGSSPTDGEDPLSQAVNWGHEQGMVMAIAAGNSGGEYFRVGCPGVADSSIAVAAVDKSGSLASFSSRGPTIDGRMKPDICAPGVYIIAPRASNTAMGRVIDDYYTKASGTSMATPHVAGVAALLKQAHPDWTSHEIKNALLLSAKDLGFKLHEQGIGLVDAARAVNVDVFLSNYGQINYGIISETNLAQTFQIEKGQISFSEDSPYFDIAPTEAVAGQDVTASLSLADDLESINEIFFTINSPDETYRGAALNFRVSVIKTRVVTDNPEWESVQPASIFSALYEPQPILILYEESEITAFVSPGIYRFNALNESIARSDGQLEAIPFAITSKPINISSFGETVYYDFQLDQAYYIPIDISQVGIIGESSYSVIYETEGGYSLGANGSIDNAISGLLVSDTVGSDSIKASISTIDTATGPMNKVHLLSWSIGNISADNLPNYLIPADLDHYHITFNDIQEAYRSAYFSIELISCGRSQMDDNFSIDLYAQKSLRGSPKISWTASTYQQEYQYDPIRAENFKSFGMLPFPKNPGQGITVGSGGTYPEAPNLVVIDQSTNPPTFDWDDVPSDNGVTYQVYLGDGYTESYMYDFNDGSWKELPGPVNYNPFETMLLVTDSQYTPSRPLPQGKYGFWVRAIDNQGYSGVWSERLAFEVSVDDCLYPDTPSLISPKDGIELNDRVLIFDWEDVMDASGVHYEFALDNNSDFSSPIVSIIDTSEPKLGLIESNYTLNMVLNTGTYFWRVRALDGAMNYSPWSQIRSFNTIAPPMNHSPVALIKANPMYGDVPLTVDFSGKESYDPNGEIVGYEWEFGDGYTSSGVTVSHIYNTAGNYTAMLTVTDNEGATNAVSLSIHVNQPPVAIVTANPMYGIAPLAVDFNGRNSYDPDGYSLSYEWDFGDGVTNTWGCVSHTYNMPGTYVATLTVTDNDDSSATTSLIIEVAAPINQPPVAKATANPMNGVAPLTVDFSGQSSYDPDSRGYIVNYKWDYGDGTTSSGVTVSHTYNTAGSYTATLTVTDNWGAEARAFLNITASINKPPVGEISYTIYKRKGTTTVCFDGTGSIDLDGHIISCKWDFGDGDTDNNLRVNHIYDEKGTYTVTLYVTDDKNAVSSEQITVKI